MSKQEKPPIAVKWTGSVFQPADRDSAAMASIYNPGTRLNASFTKIIPVIWDGTVFRAADMYAVEAADAYARGTTLDVVLKRPTGSDDKRAGELRLWWAGLGLLADNVDDERWPNKRKLHNLILEELGYVEKIWRIDGTYRLVVDSIAIDNMEDDEFAGLFERSRAFCVLHFGFDPWQTWVDERNAEKANKGFT